MSEYETFTTIYEKNKRLVKYLCNNNEDLEQEVWKDVWKNITRGNFKATTPAYIHTAINHSLALAKRYKKYRPFDSYIETFFKEEWQTTPDIAYNFETTEMLENFFGTLTPNETETIKLIAAGYEGAEISRIQKNTRQAVSKTKRRVNRKAKAFFSSYN